MPLSCPSEVKMGDGRHSPTEWMTHYPASSTEYVRSPAKPEFAFDDVPVSIYSPAPWIPTTSWWGRVFAACSVICAFYSGRSMYGSRNLVRAMEREMLEMKALMEKAETSHQAAHLALLEVRARRSEMQEINDKLQHEIKMIHAMKEEGVNIHPLSGERTLQSWMEEREVGLRQHWQTLRNFLQNQSRDALIERFGTGPYFVEVVVEIDREHQRGIQKTFVVEMASMFDVPHSVYFFLDSVDKGLWNNTVFLHHEDVEHVVAAVPLDSESQSLKQEGLQKLELQTLAFPEYSASYPHEKYTLGFANLGPTFYINTADNRKAHGPGGQEHHRLPDDADPCFARVVQGVEVVDEMIKYGLQSQNIMDPNAEHPWAGTDNKWSRIVSMKIQSPRVLP